VLCWGIVSDLFRSALYYRQVKIQKEVGKEEVPAELVKLTLKTVAETKDLLGRFRSEGTDEQKEQEKEQPGLVRIRRYHELKSGELIPMTQEELAELKRRSNVVSEFKSLTLLGFKKKETMRLLYNLKSYFVYPSDTVIEGSIAAFAHLHRSMLTKNVVGIGELLVRHSATSRLVSIQPIEEEVDCGDADDNDGQGDGKTQKSPPGWIVTQLPFSNECRAMPADESTKEGFEVPEELFPALEDLMNKMRLQEFDLVHEFKNDYLEKFWVSE
jgi:non-homologous end joining protein Ku